ncbi:MAG: hypothetical protein IJY19_07210 [Ruminococcus sp.]|nr:hypothetical protein [Ruminococcus sp.]
MINIILDTYLRKQKEVKKCSRFFVLLVVILFSITIASLFVLSIKEDAILFYVLDFAAIIIFFIWCIFVQKREIQRSGERFTEYNKSLDLLNDILEKELKDEKGKAVYWNSGKQIEYLIQEDESWIASLGNSNQNIINYAKTIVFPIIGFLVGLIAKNENADVLIILTTVILILAVYIYGFGKMIKDFIDSIFKSGSPREMRKLVNMLKDLQARTYKEKNRSCIDKK